MWFLVQADDEKEKEKDAAFMQQLEEEFDEFEEEFLKEYRQKRLEEIRKSVENTYVIVRFHWAVLLNF